MTIEPSISYDNLKSDDKKRYLAAMSERETLEYYLSPIYSREALKDLNTDELKDLLDELADRYYQINMKNGGSVKPEDYLQHDETIRFGDRPIRSYFRCYYFDC